MSDKTSPDQFHIFFSSSPSMQIIDTKGQPIVFVSSRFHTKDPDRIAFLQKMIADGTSAVFTDPNQLTLSAADLDPLTVLKKKHIAEFLAEQAKHLDPANNPGASVQGPLNAASTTDIAPVAAGGGPIAARLATVTKPAAQTN